MKVGFYNYFNKQSNTVIEEMYLKKIDKCYDSFSLIKKMWTFIRRTCGNVHTKYC